MPLPIITASDLRLALGDVLSNPSDREARRDARHCVAVLPGEEVRAVLVDVLREQRPDFLSTPNVDLRADR
jgi:hypothetical protein